MSTLEQMVREFARKYPTPRSHPNGGDLDWDQDCGAAMSRLCKMFGVEPTGDVRSAKIVWDRTKTAGTDPHQAPVGAFHFWDIGGQLNGHVGVDVFGGGGTVFMGNASVQDIEGAVNLGFNSVDGYNRYRPSAKYLGWTTTYANGNLGHFDLPAAPQPAAAPSGNTVGPIIRSGADWAYRRPQGALAQRVANGLIGLGRLPKDYKNDGDPGVVFDKAIQHTLNVSGKFKGDEDGKVERGGCYGLQDYASSFGGYTLKGGKRDGRPEGLTWTCVAIGLEAK
jgi:hypothetical protein